MAGYRKKFSGPEKNDSLSSATMSVVSDMSTSGESTATVGLADKLSQLTVPISQSGKKEDIYTLANTCREAEMPADYLTLMKQAVELNHDEAAHQIASWYLQQEPPSVDFLQDYCERWHDSADTRCLFLLAQCMEEHVCGLQFNLQVAANMLESVVRRCFVRAQTAENDNVSLNEIIEALRAKVMLVRFQLDYRYKVLPGCDAHATAKDTLYHFLETEVATNKGCVTAFLSRSSEAAWPTDDRRQLALVAGRIADLGGEVKTALQHYWNAERCRSSQFTLARIAALTEDDELAQRLLPQAVAWLDSEGVGLNDQEMPDVVLRHYSVQMSLHPDLGDTNVKLFLELAGRAVRLQSADACFRMYQHLCTHRSSLSHKRYDYLKLAAKFEKENDRRAQYWHMLSLAYYQNAQRSQGAVRTQRFVKAIAHARAALSSQPSHKDSIFLLAVCLINCTSHTNCQQESVQLLQKLGVDALLNHAEHIRNERRSCEAVELVRAGLVAFAGNLALLSELATIYENGVGVKANLSRAKELYEEAKNDVGVLQVCKKMQKQAAIQRAHAVPWRKRKRKRGSDEQIEQQKKADGHSPTTSSSDSTDGF